MTLSPASRSRVREQWSTLLCKGNALAQAELSWAEGRLEQLLGFSAGDDFLVQPRTPPKQRLPTTSVAAVRVQADVDTPAVQPAMAVHAQPRRVAVRAAPAPRRVERLDPRFEVDVPVRAAPPSRPAAIRDPSQHSACHLVRSRCPLLPTARRCPSVSRWT
jgi:hypothetical protein